MSRDGWALTAANEPKNYSATLFPLKHIHCLYHARDGLIVVDDFGE